MQKFLIDADQINSLIFSVCGEEVKEKAIEEWLNEFAEKQANGQEKIIAAIADCLNKQEVARQKWNGNIVKIPVVWPEGIDINDLAEEIAAAIAPLVSPAVLKDYFDNLPKEISRTVDGDYSDFDTPF